MLDAAFTFDAVEKNETPLAYLLLGAGFYEKYPHYRFDMNTRKFYETVDCEFLKYIKAEQYLKVSDMFASKNSKGYLESPTAFYNDYEALWQKAYRKKEYIWKKMCGLLEAYHRTADKIVTIQTDVTKDKASYIKYRFLVPAAAYEGVCKLISTMTVAEIFGKESEVYFYTTDSCEVNIEAPQAIAPKIRSLMADPYVLSQPEHMEFIKTPYSVSVLFDYLTVENLDLRGAGKHADRIREMLQLLEDEFAFITGYTESGEENQFVSFTYATKRIKKLLTTAGNILEIYVYHKCLKSDLFDDVATSYEISWDGTQVKSEFDIMITKGFAGLLIEAKATEDIDQEYYFKLSCLAKQFGTNCIPVLIADTVEKWYNDNSGNEMQRQRGDMLDVITVSDPQDIDEIDRTLARLLGVAEQPAPQVPKRVGPVSTSGQASSPPKQPQPQTPSQPRPSDMTREAFLAQKITVLRMDQAQISVLQNNGVRTIADFLAQTEETFSMMKTKNGKPYTAYYMHLQATMRKKLDSL